MNYMYKNKYKTMGDQRPVYQTSRLSDDSKKKKFGKSQGSSKKEMVKAEMQVLEKHVESQSDNVKLHEMTAYNYINKLLFCLILTLCPHHILVINTFQLPISIRNDEP